MTDDGDDLAGARTPPNDMQAERAVLGAMMLSKDAIAEVIEILHGVDFYRPANEMVFDAILDLYGRGEPADSITVRAELIKRGNINRVGGAPYLHDLLAAVTVAADAGGWAEIVHAASQRRRLIEVCDRATQMAYSGEGEIADILNQAESEVFAVAEQRMNTDYRPVSELVEPAIAEIEAIEDRKGVGFGVPTGFLDMDDLTNGLHPGQMVIVAARPAMGKALALDTPLPTPNGWTTMGEVQVGDYLIGADGKPTRVVAATDVMLDRPCYEVEFADGEQIVADAQHQWLTSDRRARRYASNPGDYREPVLPSIRTTEEIARTLIYPNADGRRNHTIAVGAPFDLPTVELPIPPYTLGAWLGDGHSAGARLTCFDPEIVSRIEIDGVTVTESGGGLFGLALPREKPATGQRLCQVCGTPFTPTMNERVLCGRRCSGKGKMEIPHCACGHRATGIGSQCAKCRNEQTMPGQLRALGVLGDKHIPALYLRASEQQRRDLLAGLLDTDGYAALGGNVQFAVTNQRLAEGCLELVRSLGYRATMDTKRVKGRSEASSICYMVNFTPSDKVFCLTRKAVRQKMPGVKARQRQVQHVRPVASVPVRCVQVDNTDHLYLAGESMVPTHNSTLALDFLRSASIRNGLCSAIFSLEMSTSEIMMRLFSAEAKVPLHNIRSGRMTNDEWGRIARKLGEVTDAPLFIDDSPNLTMNEIRSKARRLKQRHDLKLVVIDYLQLMSSGKRVESRQLEVSKFSRQIKLLAKELEIPVVAVCQLNRGPEQRSDKRPMASDLRESGSLEQDSDVIILLHREDAYEAESTRPGEADLIVAKQRNGPTRTVTVAFQGHYSRFVDMAQ